MLLPSLAALLYIAVFAPCCCSALALHRGSEFEPSSLQRRTPPSETGDSSPDSSSKDSSLEENRFTRAKAQRDRKTLRRFLALPDAAKNQKLADDPTYRLRVSVARDDYTHWRRLRAVARGESPSLDPTPLVGQVREYLAQHSPEPSPIPSSSGSAFSTRTPTFMTDATIAREVALAKQRGPVQPLHSLEQAARGKQRGTVQPLHSLEQAAPGKKRGKKRGRVQPLHSLEHMHSILARYESVPSLENASPHGGRHPAGPSKGRKQIGSHEQHAEVEQQQRAPQHSLLQLEKDARAEKMKAKEKPRHGSPVRPEGSTEWRMMRRAPNPTAPQQHAWRSKWQE